MADRNQEIPQLPHTVTGVLELRECRRRELRALLARYGMTLQVLDAGSEIPASYWGDSEAGLSGNRLLARPDTPVHSILHEACHYVCMEPQRRELLNTDAGGDYAEENAVCYLQIVLAGHLEDMGRDRMQADMDDWGYTFRLGSAGAWFEYDADDARKWLADRLLLDHECNPTWQLNHGDRGWRSRPARA